MKKPTLQQQRKEFYKAAEQVIDEYRAHYLKAVEQIVQKAEKDPQQWSRINSLVSSLRIDGTGFEGLAVKDQTVKKMLDAGFRTYGCSICGSKRWRTHGTECKPCLRRFHESINAKGPKVYVTRGSSGPILVSK